MIDSRLNRQQIYDRIKASSKDEYILQDMQRLGFWDKDGNQPNLPAQLIKKEGELQRELTQLLAEKQRYSKKEEILKDMRKKRMEAAKEKRTLTKERKEQARVDKAARWTATKEQDIIFLGEGVSGGLNNKDANTQLLLSKGLPPIGSIEDFSRLTGLPIGQLRFLSFHRKVATSTHYKRFSIPKKSGGRRTISAPMPRLKFLQYWILKNILDKIPVHAAANGFTTGRSILSNAAHHVNKDVVINIDLKDFFPTLDYARVKGMFVKLGYSEQIATLLGLICTEPEREEAVLDGKKYFVATGKRVLPQGAPTSPAITNIICYKMDCRFSGMCGKIGFIYSRYADDLSFSANGNEQLKKIQPLLWRAKKIVTEEGFVVHPEKIKVMRKGARQEVTGIVVNKKPGINRKMLHRFRAVIHQISAQGLENKKWKGGNLVAETMGYANFVAQVKPLQGNKMKDQLKEIFSRPAIRQQIQQLGLMPPARKADPPAGKKDQQDKNEGKNWWDVL